MRTSESVKVEMIFDPETGELLDVNPLEGKKTELGKIIKIEDLQEAGLNKFTQGSYLYGWGSPGCVVYRTSTRYIRICW